MRFRHPSTRRTIFQIFISCSIIAVTLSAVLQNSNNHRHPRNLDIDVKKELINNFIQPTHLSLRSTCIKPSLRTLNRIRGGSSSSDGESGMVDGDGKEDEALSEVGVKTRKKTTKRRRRRRRHRSSTSSVGDGDDGDGDDKDKDGRNAINAAMRGKDSADIMGDSIRARRKDLLQDDLNLKHPIPSHNAADATLSSLRYALGSSDATSYTTQISTKTRADDEYDEGGGVEVSTSAVIANYFLKSHGGVHSIQSLASILSVVFGVAALLLLPKSLEPNKKSDDQIIQALNLKLQFILSLVQKTLICALMKHFSGFISLARVSASQLPDIGWKKMRRRLEGFVLDPVAQYLFYCALLYIWSKTGLISIGATATVGASAKAAIKTDPATTILQLPWWLTSKHNKAIITCLIGPILAREIISTIWVLSDILVLVYASGSTSKIILGVLSVGCATTDAIMSLILKPKTWRDADVSTRQRLLANLVSRTSLALELGTGLILLCDAIWAFGAYSLTNKAAESSRSLSVRNMVIKIFCARLYLNFMLVRRKRIEDLIGGIRGGAIHVPERILDILLEPGNSMGLNWSDDAGGGVRRNYSTNEKSKKMGKNRGDEKMQLKDILYLLGF